LFFNSAVKFVTTGRHWIAGSLSLQQVFRLLLEMVEVGIRWEAFDRHDELPFVRPRSAFAGRKSVREIELSLSGGLLVLSADRMRPLRSADLTTTKESEALHKVAPILHDHQ